MEREDSYRFIARKGTQVFLMMGIELHPNAVRPVEKEILGTKYRRGAGSYLDSWDLPDGIYEVRWPDGRHERFAVSMGERVDASPKDVREARKLTKAKRLSDDAPKRKRRVAGDSIRG